MRKPLVLVTMPMYNMQVDSRAHTGQTLRASLGRFETHWGDFTFGSPLSCQSSLLEHTFNRIWIAALNGRNVYNVRYFAMLHADVEPAPGWVDILVEEKERVGADIISAVIPLKLPTGVTSTGLGDPSWPRGQAAPFERARKLTMHEVCELPETFSAADVDPSKVLLINTGCWVCDFNKPWVEKITWAIHSRNYIGTDGHWHTACRGEDWDFSLQCHDLGLKVFATRKLKVVHHGDFGYANWPAWGSMKTDEDYAAFMKSDLPILGVVAPQEVENAGIGPVAAVKD